MSSGVSLSDWRKDFEKCVPAWFKALLNNYEVFCAPARYGDGYGVIEAMMESDKNIRWDFIVDTQVFDHIDKALHGETENNYMVAIAAVFVAIARGNLIVDYGLWERCSGLTRYSNSSKALRCIGSLKAIRENLALVEELLINHFTGKDIQQLKNQLAIEAKEHESMSIEFVKGGRVLPGDLMLLGNSIVLKSILFAAELQKLVLYNDKRGKDLFLSFIESCERQKIPFSTRAIYYAAAVCNNHLSRTVKRKGFKIEDESNIAPKHISLQDIVNIAFDLV